jgi:hypothetical protein
MDPQVSKEEVPSYEIVEEKIKQIDSAIIILRIFYILEHISYKFQLLKNNKICTVEISKKLLDELKDGNPTSEEKLMETLNLHIQRSDCWNEI